MCGILGYTHMTNSLPPGVLLSGLGSLIHRGPNQQGYFTSRDVSFGATRLRITDLDDGDQPLYSSDNDTLLVFNGEIFNYRELRAELESEGARFKTHCDTEVVLNAFLHWGEKCFSRLRGMFAMGIWVQSERRMLLARDRMGIKPLYYCLHDQELLFGSELKCIFAHPAVPRKIDVNGLNCFLRLNYVPGPMTLVEGITKLMPGHFLEWHNGRCTTKPYLHSPAQHEACTPPSLGEASAQLDVLLSESIREQLASEVPVGIWLSGGLDSSTVLHYAACNLTHDLQTFSVTFQGRSFDESKYIREMAALFGTKHTEIDLNTDLDIGNAIEKIAYYSDEPSADAGALPLWFLSEITSNHATVCLSGEGADELFAGYLTYKADYYSDLARKVPKKVREFAFQCANRLPVSDEKISFEYKLKRFCEGLLLPAEEAHVFWNGTFSEAEKQALFHFADSRPLAGILAGMGGSAGPQKYLDFDQRYYLPDDILYKVDRISMAHSIEVRPPFLDPRIVEFAARLPYHFKFNGAKSKRVLRHLMQNKLPSTMLRRPKIGFDIPIHDWFRGVLRPLLLDTLSEKAVTESGLFHWPAIKRLINDHLERKQNRGYHLWGLMTLFIWMKRWNIEPPLQRAKIPAEVDDVFDMV